MTTPARDAATRPRPDGCICPLNDYGDVVDADPACPKHAVEAEWTPGKRVRRARVIFRVRVLRRLQTKITGKPLTWTTDEIMALHGFTREELDSE